VVTSHTRGEFRTDSGREVMGGGGIQPDQVVNPAQADRLTMVLDASGVITNFATEYLRSHTLAGDFEVTPAMLDELKVFLSERKIQPGVGEWITHQGWIESRLKQELTNLAFGVAKGDQIEIARDPVVQAARKKLTP